MLVDTWEGVSCLEEQSSCLVVIIHLLISLCLCLHTNGHFVIAKDMLVLYELYCYNCCLSGLVCNKYIRLF